MVLQADVYSLGVLLWEIVTSDVPERGRMRPVKVRPTNPVLCCAVHLFWHWSQTLLPLVTKYMQQAHRVLLYTVTAGSLYFCE